MFVSRRHDYVLPAEITPPSTAGGGYKTTREALQEQPTSKKSESPAPGRGQRY